MVEPKELVWLASTQDDLREFPIEPRREVGYALWEAQNGRKHRGAKPLKGFHGASVLEILEDHDGDAFRAVYTVRFAEAVYVLHCFQKKSKSGVSTPKHDVELIKGRLKLAEREHQKWQESQSK